VHIAEQAGYDFSFLRGAIATNEEQFVRVVDKVKTSVGGDLTGAVVAVWGLTFKAGTDDLRNSPAVEIVQRLVADGAIVRVFDPTVVVPSGLASIPVDELPAFAGEDGGLGPADAVRAYPDAYAACAGAAVAVVLTEWDQFRWLDFNKVLSTMAEPVVVDARNLLDPAQLRRLGFEYTGIGRR
jgi:UDPglucose 6-dehydrogenase